MSAEPLVRERRPVLPTRVVASAPGKLILFGEHAAVFGRPALVAAVNRRVRVTGRTVEAPGLQLVLPDLGGRRTAAWAEVQRTTRRARDRWQAWRSGESRFVGLDDPAELAVVAVGEVLEEMPTCGLEIAIESDLPVGCGLGSSAAVGLAVAAAASRLVGRSWSSAELERVALEIERRQHGTPSGVDTATVLRGGVVRATRAPEGGLLVERRRLPGWFGAALGIFDSGRPASGTGEVVGSVRAHRMREPGIVENACDEIGRVVDAVDRLLLAPSRSEPLVGLVRAAHRALDQLGVVPETVAVAIGAIEAAGGAAKISGAGSTRGEGAGIVLVLAPTGTVPIPGGWVPLDLEIGAPGLTVEESE